MSRTRRSVLLAACCLLAVAAGWAVRAGLLGRSGSRPPQNSILLMAPYEHNGTWVFDDDAVGLKREPFVAGVPEMIDALVSGIPDAKQEFRLLFSAKEFPGFQKKLTWARSAGEGNYYKLDEPPMEGWICPALFKYYERPPAEIYVKAEPLRRS